MCRRDIGTEALFRFILQGMTRRNRRLWDMGRGVMLQMVEKFGVLLEKYGSGRWECSFGLHAYGCGNAGVMCHARELGLFGEFLLQCLAPEPWQRDSLEPSQRFD